MSKQPVTSVLKGVNEQFNKLKPISKEIVIQIVGDDENAEDMLILRLPNDHELLDAQKLEGALADGLTEHGVDICCECGCYCVDVNDDMGDGNVCRDCSPVKDTDEVYERNRDRDMETE